MNTLIVGIITAVLSVSFGALISFFITTISQRKVTVSIIKELIDTHEKIHHKTPVKAMIEEHETKCTASKDIEEMKKGISILVQRAKLAT